MKRIICCFLICCLMLSLLPSFVYGAEEAAMTGRSFTADKLLTAQKPLKTAPRTLETWICFPEGIPASTRGGVILGNYYDINRNVFNFEIYHNGAPRLYWVAEDGKVTNLIFTNVSVYNGLWNHLAVVLDESAGKVHCYLNGELAQSLSMPVAPQIPAACMVLGGDYRNGNTQYFKGQIHSVTLYGTARTKEEIAQDRKGSCGVALASWDLSTEADSYKDLSAHAYDLALSDFGRRFTPAEHNVISKPFAATPDTVQAWIRFPADLSPNTRGGIILGNYKDGGRGLFNAEIYRNGNPRLYYVAPDGKLVERIFNEVNVYTGEWLHLTIVRDKSAKQAHCYVNGKLEQSLSLEAPDFAPSTALVLGGDCRNNNTLYFKGEIRSVAVYADARTQTEITADMGKMGNGDPLAYWDVRVEASRYADYSGNGYPIIRTQEGPDFQPNDLYKISESVSAMPKTVEAWICFPKDMEESVRGGVILGNYPASKKNILNVEIYSKGHPRVYYHDANGAVTNVIFDQVNVYTGQWVHLAVVQDVEAKALHCYVNGVLAQTVSATVPQILPAAGLCVGSDLRNGNEQYFKGRIRSVCLYSDVRTEEEILSDRNKTGNGDPMAYWNFLHPADSYTDLSGHGYHINRSALWLTEKAPVNEYDFTFVAVGDTQIVARKDRDNGTKNLDRVYQWILSQKEAQNIQYVMGLGDITDGNTDAEWKIAQDAIHQLNGKIPYSLVRGNHDGSAKINATFNNPAVSPYSGSYEGSYDGTLNNTWRTITAGSNQIPYLIMTLDYGPTDAILAWADKVVREHPYHNVIITTHAYLFRDGTTLDSGDVCPPSNSGAQYNNGDQMWEKFVKKHSNIVMVLSGHDPSAYVVVNQDKGEKGNVITQMLIDPQGVDASNLTGAVALLHFSADGSKVSVEYYATLQGAYYRSENQFDLEVEVVSPALMEVPVYHSLNLASDISMNYVIPAASLEGFADFTMKCSIPQYEGNTLVGTETVTLQPELRGSYYYFTLTGLTALRVNDEIEAVLVAEKNGKEFISQSDVFSVAAYAYGQLNNAGSAEKLRILCAELLRYGAMAQSYKGYRTDALADARMTAEQRALLSDLQKVTFGNHNSNGAELLNPAVTWVGKTLDLNTKVTVVYVVNVANYAGDPKNLSLRIHCGDGKEPVILRNPQMYGGKETYYAFRMDQLLAAELRTVLTAQVYVGDTPVSNSSVFSADTYGNGKTGLLGELCKALFAYSDSAKVFFQ